MRSTNYRRKEAEDAVRSWQARHDGVISRRQALTLGLSPAQVQQRVANGQWTRRHSGVYVLSGTPASPRQDINVALAAVPGGMTAAASHLTAAWLWGFLDRAPEPVHLLVPPECRTPLRFATLTRTKVRPRVEMRNGLPCTSALRTLIDCAGVVPRSRLVDLVDRSTAAGAISLSTIDRELRRTNRTSHLPGRSILVRSFTDRGVLGGPTPSVLESRAARLFNRPGLDDLKAELVWGPNQEYRLDYADPEVKLAIEFDGFAWHASSERKRRSERRRRKLGRANWLVLAYDWVEVTYEGEAVAEEILATRRERRASWRGASRSGGTAAAGW
jgi:very-short-patch-repair endonuclease